MPKQTFFNLPEEKRNHILDVAVEEFAAKGYKQASISGIVAGAGIAKGSFYQYFEDKDDLFCHIVCEMIAERKIQTYQDEKDKLADLTLTEFLRVVFHRQITDFEMNPSLLKIGLDLATLTRDPIYAKVIEQYRGDVDTYFMPFIQYEAEQGEIDSKVNQRLLNFMLISLGQYITALMTAGGVEIISHELIDRIVDDLEYILTYGIYGRFAQNGIE